MKKIYFLAATALAVSFFNAQSLTAVAPSTEQVTISKNSTAVLYQQDQTAGNGIVSDVLNTGKFVMCADDFKLNSNADVEKFSFLGFQQNKDLAALNKGVSLYIYANNNGVPAGIPGDGNPYLLKIDLPETSTAYTLVSPAQNSTYLYTVDVVAATGAPLKLMKDTTYWVTFAPKVNLSAYTNATRWNWFVGTITGESAKLVDPSNAFNAGATNWTDISALTGDGVFDGLAFAIEGENSLGTNEVYSTIKEVMVAQEDQNLFVFAKNDKVRSVDVFSADGKKVLTGDASTLNISSLTKGMYIVKVSTVSGKVKSTKFLKK